MFLAALAVVAVWATVGPAPAVLMGGLLLAHWWAGPKRRLLSTAAVVLVISLPVLWFLGSSVPLTPPATRISDNLVAHQAGGLAIWTLFLAAWVEVRSGESDAP
ncbi:hypothetical protein [Janibacter sp. G56]|uniref:hypothetical protein n=1 Tax=Janibacter sp. G56 TaxID=3418717 RepID=UPI003D03850B